MLLRTAAAITCLLLLLPGPTLAQDDAGDTFFDAEELPFGQLSVSGELLVEFRGPDLYLGIRDQFGGIAIGGEGQPLVDDDSSDFGDGFAPGLIGVPVNPGGEIAFDITGFGDTEFVGDHVEFGDFEVFVDVYTFVDDQFVYLDGLSFLDTIDDQVEEQAVVVFSDFDASWDGAFYDIQVNNAFPNDIDFWRFTGLPAGEPFTAETLEVPGAFIDTALGLFNDNGDLIASDDDSGQFGYSKLSGVVPSSGEVVLAVTGFEDLDFFEGSHRYKGPYELDITLGDAPIAGDYDGDLDVDSNDYTAWVNAFGASGDGLPTDGNADGVVDAADYTVWRDAFDAQPLAVPEPAGQLLLAGLAGLALARAR